ncbi:SLAM family member 5-like isoform X2 [Misgurnus anguillicaudatus]|uniref:SLAM family member 5-like isoform X2 n=1 Tax=Misgurnus anguillicaudatus TaxID=75329 RepID=UPI003CCF42FA
MKHMKSKRELTESSSSHSLQTTTQHLMKKMFLMFVYFYLCFCCLTGVFGDEVKSVSVMEGDSLTLQTDTKLQRDHLILWMFGPQEAVIAEINKEANKFLKYANVLDGRFRDRLQVNNQTGDLTITNINTEDSGLYHINIRSNRITSHRFNVIVYARLPVPVITRNSSQCSSSSANPNCVLLCSVLNVRDVSLSWYKGNSLLSIISVSDLNIRLSLPLEVEYQDTNTYRCVLNNTITNQTQHLNINDVCQTCSDTTGLSTDDVILILRVVAAVAPGFLMSVASVLMFWIYSKNTNTQQQESSSGGVMRR